MRPLFSRFTLYVYQTTTKGCYSLQATSAITPKTDKWSCGLQRLPNRSNESRRSPVSGRQRGGLLLGHRHHAGLANGDGDAGVVERYDGMAAVADRWVEETPQVEI